MTNYTDNIGKRERKYRYWDGKTMYDVTTYVGFKDGKMHCFEDHSGGVFLEYTGLKDKNGKEIYEGDILKVFYYDNDISKDFFSIWSVEYNLREAQFCVGYAHNLRIDNYRDIEVIGNVFENPDLLSQPTNE